MQEKEEIKRKAEQKSLEIQNKKDIIKQTKESARELIANEVDNATLDPKSTVKVAIKMPNGNRLSKNFSSLHTIHHLRSFILMDDQISSLEFIIGSNFPSKTYENDEVSLEEAFGGAKNQLLFIKAAKDDTIEENSSSTEDSEESESSEENSEWGNFSGSSEKIRGRALQVSIYPKDWLTHQNLKKKLGWSLSIIMQQLSAFFHVN